MIRKTHWAFRDSRTRLSRGQKTKEKEEGDRLSWTPSEVHPKWSKNIWQRPISLKVPTPPDSPTAETKPLTRGPLQEHLRLKPRHQLYFRSMNLCGNRRLMRCIPLGITLVAGMSPADDILALEALTWTSWRHCSVEQVVFAANMKDAKCLFHWVNQVMDGSFQTLRKDQWR